MGNYQNKKLLALVIYSILLRETDEYHRMTTEALLDAVKARGFACDRKTLYNSISDMNEAGFEIMKIKSRTNSYYVCDRVFDDSELKMLIDAMQAAAFLTPTKTEKLCDKIASLAGRTGAESLKRNTVEFNITKNSNENVVYSVSSISEAIDRHKKIEFKYFYYDADHNRRFQKDGELYAVNPLFMVYTDDKYYLICYKDNHDSVGHYRLDRMTEVRVSDENITVRPEMLDIDVGAYKKELFGMYSGERVAVRFVVSASDNYTTAVNAVFDKFGPDTVMTRIDEGHVAFTADVRLSDPFFAWLSIFRGSIKIAEPRSAMEEFALFIQENSAAASKSI